MRTIWLTLALIALVDLAAHGQNADQILERRAADALHGDQPADIPQPTPRDLMGLLHMPQRFRHQSHAPDAATVKHYRGILARCWSPPLPADDGAAEPLVTARAVAIDFAPLAKGVGVLTVRSEVTSQLPLRELRPVVTQLDAEGRPLNSYVGACLTPKLAFCALELDPEAESVQLSFYASDGPVAAEWIDAGGKRAREKRLPIDRKALIAGQAEKRAAELQEAATPDDTSRVGEPRKTPEIR